MQYLEYQEYLNIGGVLDSTAFNRYITRACGVITNATHNRISEMATVPDEVKAACRDLVEYIASNADTGKTVTSRSQSSGPVSQSESYEIKSQEQQDTEMYNIMRDYLMSVEDDSGTALLYRGCRL